MLRFLLLLALPCLLFADPMLRPEAPPLPLRPEATDLSGAGEVVQNRPKGRNAHDLNRRIANVNTAAIFLYRPEAGVASLRTGVVICPGGGYAGVVIDKEGHDYARLLASRGVTALVLKYRLPGGVPPSAEEPPRPLADAILALRWLRSRAAELNLDPARIGILGSSAGGHLAASAAAFAPDADPASTDPLERVSARPSFLGLIYPVVSMDPAITHSGSRAELLGPAPTPEMTKRFSIEEQVSTAFPPTFIVHARDDGVKVENSLRLLAALERAGVPASARIVDQGGHGFGLAAKHPQLSRWPDDMLTWLKTQL